MPANLDKAKVYLKMAVATGWPQARANLIAIQRLVLDSDRSDKERHNE